MKSKEERLILLILPKAPAISPTRGLTVKREDRHCVWDPPAHASFLCNRACDKDITLVENRLKRSKNAGSYRSTALKSTDSRLKPKAVTAAITKPIPSNSLRLNRSPTIVDAPIASTTRPMAISPGSMAGPIIPCARIFNGTPRKNCRENPASHKGLRSNWLIKAVS